MTQRDEIELRAYTATTPDDTEDPPRFGQLVETAKDAFVLALRRFFDRAQTAERLGELPIIEKYAIGQSVGEDPYVTTVRLLQEYPDLKERLPHISVTGGGARNKRLTVGRPLIDRVQLAPRVVGTGTEPFVLADDDTLVVRTKPDGIDWVTSTLVLRSGRFPSSDPITAATAADVARVINEQALYVTTTATADGGLVISTGGPYGKYTPNAIEVLTGSTANLLTELGFTVGQSDSSDNAARPPMWRYHLAGECTINIDVICTDVNTRRELADLVFGWATFWLERQHFTMLGRGTFEPEVYPDEHYQITLNQETSMGPETFVPRPGDQSDKVHVQRISVPVVVIQYIDRPVLVPSGPAQGDVFETNADDGTLDDDLVEPS